VRPVLGREADPPILHVDRDLPPGAAGADIDRRPRRAVLGGVVEQVVQELAEQRRVRLTSHEPEAPLTLDADPGQAQVALRCLLRNALEAAPPEGWAAVRAHADGDAVELLVEDSGPGPSAADREHLFDPFYSGRKAGRGPGLGLCTAWRLAREHGGDVRFDAGAAGPTRFTLRLPRGQARPPAPAPEPAPGGQPVLEVPAASALKTDEHAAGRNGSICHQGSRLPPPESGPGAPLDGPFVERSAVAEGDESGNGLQNQEGHPPRSSGAACG